MGRPLGLRVTPFPSARTEQSCLRHPSAPADGSASAAPRKPAEAYGSSLAPLIWETRGTGRLASRSFFQTPPHACSALLRLLALRRPLLRASTALSLPLALPLALPTPMLFPVPIRNVAPPAPWGVTDLMSLQWGPEPPCHSSEPGGAPRLFTERPHQGPRLHVKHPQTHGGGLTTPRL